MVQRRLRPLAAYQAACQSTEIAERFMPTRWLTLAGMASAVVFGMMIGIVSAVYRNSGPADRA